MLTSSALRACALVAGLASLPAAAQDLALIDTIGDWKLYFSEELGNSCLEMHVDDKERQFQVGVDRRKEYAYAGLFVNAEADVVDGESAPVSFELGDTLFVGEAKGYSKDGIEGGYVYFNNLDFAYELAKQKTLTINRINGDKIEVDLTGSADAIDALIACQVVSAQ